MRRGCQSAGFWYGRRVCQGSVLASLSLLLSQLQAFKSASHIPDVGDLRQHFITICVALDHYLDLFLQRLVRNIWAFIFSSPSLSVSVCVCVRVSCCVCHTLLSIFEYDFDEVNGHGVALVGFHSFVFRKVLLHGHHVGSRRSFYESAGVRFEFGLKEMVSLAVAERDSVRLTTRSVPRVMCALN